MSFILDIFRDALMITSFVMVIMLIIEYINVRSKGSWSNFLKRSWVLQLLFAALLGIAPGCLGSFAAVSLYTHNIINFAALLTTMIATFGDEVLIIFSQSPETALKLAVLLFIIAISAGIIIKLIPATKLIPSPKQNFHLNIHQEHADCCNFSKKTVKQNFRKISFQRAILLFGLLFYMFGLISDHLNHNHSYFSSSTTMPKSVKNEKKADTTNQHEKIQNEVISDKHNHEAEGHESHKHSENEGIDWAKIISIIGILAVLVIISIVPDHFLEEHLWGHIIKKHFLKIFLWTIGALILIHLLLDNVNLLAWVQENHFIVLLLALLIGLIPESGPHILFFSLYLSGAIPFTILLANSIVQDGHGALPLLAESKKSFIVLKLIKFVIGLAIWSISLFFF